METSDTIADSDSSACSDPLKMERTPKRVSISEEPPQVKEEVRMYLENLSIPKLVIQSETGEVIESPPVTPRFTHSEPLFQPHRGEGPKSLSATILYDGTNEPKLVVEGQEGTDAQCLNLLTSIGSKFVLTDDSTNQSWRIMTDSSTNQAYMVPNDDTLQDNPPCNVKMTLTRQRSDPKEAKSRRPSVDESSTATTAAFSMSTKLSGATLVPPPSVGVMTELQSNLKSHSQPHKLRRNLSRANPRFKYRMPTGNARMTRSNSSCSISSDMPSVHLHQTQNDKRPHHSPSGTQYQPSPRRKNNIHSAELTKTSSLAPQQQQFIYLQLPQTQAQDQAALQQLISSQLQNLLPQIYSQMLNQSQKSTKNILGQFNLQPSCKMASSSEKLTSQLIVEDVLVKTRPPSPQENANVVDYGVPSTPEIVPPPVAFSCKYPLHSAAIHTPVYSSVEHPTEGRIVPGGQDIPEIVIHCQNPRENYLPFQPKLETILEESSWKRPLQFGKFSKAKLLACVLTTLFVTVVIVLTGNKTLAVITVSGVVVCFFLIAVWYLVNHPSSSGLTTVEPSVVTVTQGEHPNKLNMVA